MTADAYARFLAVPWLIVGGGEAVQSKDLTIIALIVAWTIREVLGAVSLWIRAKYRWRDDLTREIQRSDVNAARAALGLGPLPPEEGNR